jgi:UrcA family protein
MMKLSMILTATLVLSTAAQAAGPQDITVEGAPTARVSYAGLDLNSAAGRRQLTDRIQSAASGLCVEPIVRPIAEKMDQARCYRRAVSSGEIQMSQLALPR